MADQAFPGEEAYPTYIKHMRKSTNVDSENEFADWHAEGFADAARLTAGYEDKIRARGSQLAKDAGLNDIGSNK